MNKNKILEIVKENFRYSLCSQRTFDKIKCFIYKYLKDNDIANITYIDFLVKSDHVDSQIITITPNNLYTYLILEGKI